MTMYDRPNDGWGELTTKGWDCVEIPANIRCLKHTDSVCDRRLTRRRCPHWIPPSIIYIPSDRMLSEAWTILFLSAAYATIKPRPTERKLVQWVFNRIIECEAIVIGSDGREIDVLEIDVDRVFGDNYSWIGDFQSARFRAPKQRPSKKIILRYRLLWLALASVNAKLAADVLK